MLAHYDRLTGLPNRSFLEERLATLHSGAKRHTDPFAVLLVDINRFEEIRDTHGQAIGDQVLKAFAQKLMSASRASDTFGRFGGAEFLYLMDREVSYAKVEQACVRLAEALSFSVELDSVKVALSASIGAAIYPFDGKTSDELLRAAEQALHAAKTNSGGYHLPHQAQSVSAGTSQTAAAVADPETRGQPLPSQLQQRTRKISPNVSGTGAASAATACCYVAGSSSTTASPRSTAPSTICRPTAPA